MTPLLVASLTGRLGTHCAHRRWETAGLTAEVLLALDDTVKERPARGKRQLGADRNNGHAGRRGRRPKIPDASAAPGGDRHIEAFAHIRLRSRFRLPRHRREWEGPCCSWWLGRWLPPRH